MTNYKEEYPDGINPNFWSNFVVPNVNRIKGHKCEFCGCKDNLDVHHTDYDTEISIFTLMLLCRSCHVKEHKKLL